MQFASEQENYLERVKECFNIKDHYLKAGADFYVEELGVRQPGKENEMQAKNRNQYEY